MPRPWDKPKLKPEDDVWRTWILDWMQERGMTMIYLAEMLGEERPNRINAILRGYYGKSKRPPNRLHVDEVEAWADVLQMNAETRERFRELVNLDWCEPWFRERYLKLKADASRLAREASSR